MLFLKLKKCHGDVNTSKENVFEQLEFYKQKIDDLQLNLQSLQYESNHIQREIQICKKFKSRHHQIEDLITLEEFKKNSTEENQNGNRQKRI
jgi:prefoldin subunit 5